MKKLLMIAFITIPSFALVWEDDPSITEEERQERRELNQRIREKSLMMGGRLKGNVRVTRPMSTDEDGIPYWDIGGPGTGTPSAILGRNPITWGPSYYLKNQDDSTTNDEPDYSDED